MKGLLLSTLAALAALSANIASAGEAFPSTTIENRVKAFVYEWFAFFDDVESDESFVLSHLSPDGFEFVLPSMPPVLNKEAFLGWLNFARSSTLANSHKVESLSVRVLSDTQYTIEDVVLFSSLTGDGARFQARIAHHWEVSGVNGKDLKVTRYVAKLIKE